LAAFLWAIAHVVLLAFGAVLFALVLQSAGAFFRDRLHVPERLAFPAAVLVVLLTVAGLLWVFGTELATQIASLVHVVPDSLHRLAAWLGGRRWGEWIRGQAHQIDFSKAGSGAVSGFVQAFTSLLAALGYAVLIVVAAIYAAAQPRLYRTGMLELIPPRQRKRGAEVLGVTARALRLWLLGQLLAMTAVGLLTGFGIWLIGVPNPLALGVIAFATEFIPFIGPIIGAVPAILSGFALSPSTAVYAVIVALIVQQTENHLLQPLIQKRVVSLPPMLTLFAQVTMGLVFGPLGLLFATPLMVVALVAVKMLYLEDVLREPEIEVPGRG
jgi:predicted PurR-regulated permease PerM